MCEYFKFKEAERPRDALPTPSHQMSFCTACALTFGPLGRTKPVASQIIMSIQ